MTTMGDVMAELAEKTATAARDEATAAASRAEQHAAIIKAYREHKGLRSIAETTGYSHEGVRQILLDHGVELRGRGRPTRADS